MQHQQYRDYKYPGPTYPPNYGGRNQGKPNFYAPQPLLKHSSSMALSSTLDGVEMKIADSLSQNRVLLPVTMPNIINRPDLDSKYKYDFSLEYKVLELLVNGD
ncbi:uncharacterized protein LOC100371524 [Saccoglossus kowalevskii]|uniref:Uncharacterized protein LOC100371524 n=1 Tax=Saccoglossus kowalevskii TaxID=10224 RepID=A0ABM0GS82_SACKO|nr:PREDICTED: uncharacterized protein LOC100371524 [Saccoglossus kowalevskii]